MFRSVFCSLALFGLSALFQGRAEAGIDFTANAPKSETSAVAGVTTETFNSFTPGVYTSLNTAVGTVTSSGAAVVVHDEYGGAGATGNYFSVGAQSGYTSATLALNGPTTYFGLWWSAADPQNSIAFYSGNTLLASYTSADVFNGLTDPNYFGNPNTGQDSGEKFAYINFFGTGGTTFDHVVFSNSTTGSGFESDNWSVVPEPSSLAMTATGLLALVGVARRRRAK